MDRRAHGTPPEFTPLANAASAWATTPTNFGEWYFPTRLSLDTSIVGNLRLAADSWQVREGIRATHGAEVDVPVLAIAAALRRSRERLRGDAREAVAHGRARTSPRRARTA